MQYSACNVVRRIMGDFVHQDGGRNLRDVQKMSFDYDQQRMLYFRWSSLHKLRTQAVNTVQLPSLDPSHSYRD